LTILTPDNWIILEIKDKKTYETSHKVLAGWSGGYLTGNSWRINSGIKSIETKEDFYVVTGHSETVYHLYKASEALRMNILPILFSLRNQSEEESSPSIVEGIDMEEILPLYSSKKEL